MALKVRDVMTGIPVMLGPEQTVKDAACAMRDFAVGCVLVAWHQHLHGLITDRDIVVRTIAEAGDPATVRLTDVCSQDMAVVTPDDDVDDAVKIMRSRAVRRLPVVEGSQPVGVISLADLALEQEWDTASALADISAAPPNA